MTLPRKSVRTGKRPADPARRRSKDTTSALWGRPPEDLWFRAERKLEIGSGARAPGDAKCYIHKRRLPLLVAEDHYSYVELECIRMTEFLRALRDEYRQHLQRQAKRSAAETHWTVFNYGVKELAPYVLRITVLEYIRNSRIPLGEWEILLDTPPWAPTFNSATGSSRASTDLIEMNQVNKFLPTSVFDQILRGGPFGLEAQIELSRFFPSLLAGSTPDEAIKERQQLWHHFEPWTEGLARLFDAVQEELLFQLADIGEEGKRADTTLRELSEFERTAYRHLLEFRSLHEKQARLGDDQWLALFCELDEKQIHLEEHLPQKAMEVVRSLKRKALALNTWQEAYLSKGRTSLEDGKIRSVRRAVTQAIHNAAKNASLRLGRVWSREKQQDV